MLNIVLVIVLVVLACTIQQAQACTDVYMNFTDFKLSGRNMDLGSQNNWTITTWPRHKPGQDVHALKYQPSLAYWPAKYGSVGISGNWFGDDKNGFPSFFADSLNEKGLFCQYVAQSYESVLDLQAALPNIAIYGPDALAQHFIIRDASGKSLIIECINGEQRVYLDSNDGKTGFGVTTNEPTFDWHLENIQHYEWKRTLARQAVAIPGNFYPEERFLRAHMIKSGMQTQGLFASSAKVDYQHAFALTAQVLNSVNVPEGDQYGTDSGDSGSSEGAADHTVWAIIRDHATPTLYWRDTFNPTFRRLRLQDVDLSPGAPQKMIKMETGPFYIDMVNFLQ